MSIRTSIRSLAQVIIGVTAFSVGTTHADPPKASSPPLPLMKPWEYTSVRTTNTLLSFSDPRYKQLVADGWVMYGYSGEPAWGGGANRPARFEMIFRRPKGWSLLQQPSPVPQQPPATRLRITIEDLKPWWMEAKKPWWFVRENK